MADLYNASLLLDRNLEAGRGDKVAVRWARGEVTFAELHGLACAAGLRLQESGVRREERVLLPMDDSPALMAAFWGALRIGAIPVPVNPLLQRSEDYDHYFADSLARVVVVDGLTAEKVGGAVGRAAEPVQVLTDLELLELPPADTAPAATRRDDMAFWLYSSGSTGLPKGVVHLQHDIEYTCETYARQVLGIGETDVTLSTTKMFHAYGLGNSLTFPCWSGATAVLLSGRATPAAVLDAIERQRPTLFFSAPTLYNAILNFEGAAGRDLGSIRRCGRRGAPGRGLAALEGDLRAGGPGRHRLDRAAPYLLLQPAGRAPARLEREARSRLRAEDPRPRRRARRDRRGR